MPRIEVEIDGGVGGRWRSDRTGKIGSRTGVKEGGGTERAGGPGRNGRRAPRKEPGAWGWAGKVGPACLASTTGDWRPATAVDPGLGLGSHSLSHSLPAPAVTRTGAGTGNKAWTGTSRWLEMLCTRCTVFLCFFTDGPTWTKRKPVAIRERLAGRACSAARGRRDGEEAQRMGNRPGS